MRTSVVVLIASLGFGVGCKKADDAAKSQPVTTGSGSGSAGMFKPMPKTEQVPPPMDLKNPPADAVKTASGLIYKKETTNDAGAAPKRNDTVMVSYTGWHQSTGETFYTNRSRDKPMMLNLATAAPGFTEGMQLLKKGEKAMFWMPAAIGYRGTPHGTPETNVYEIEIVDIKPAPEVPADVAAPPAKAETTKSGVKLEVVKPGTGKDKPHTYDTVTYHYTAWDADGHMFDSTEMRDRPAKNTPYKLSAAYQDILTNMVQGERVRFWTTADKLTPTGKPAPGAPTGQLCYELQLESIEKGVEPPPVPADVAKPPGDAKKSPKGVFYKVLTAGKGGPHPKPTDTVRVNYTGWTTDGKMFDTSVTRKEPAEFALNAVIAGWTDGLQLMSPGDKYRFWIPEELAYKGAPGKPQGMLVFDVEMLEIKPPRSPDHPPMPHHP